MSDARLLAAEKRLEAERKLMQQIEANESRCARCGHFYVDHLPAPPHRCDVGASGIAACAPCDCPAYVAERADADL